MPRPVVKFGSERQTDRCPLRRPLRTARFTSAVTTESFTRSTRRPARCNGSLQPMVNADSKQKACTECNRRTRRLPTRLIFFSQVQSWRMAWFISGAGTETFMRSIRPRAICVGNSKPAMLCTPRPRSQTAFCFSEVGTVISTLWTLRQEKRNGVSMEAKTR